MNRILIMTADAGFGHRSAAKAIAAALAARPDAGQLHVDVANPVAAEGVPTFIKERQFNYDNLIQNTPELYKASYEASNLPGATSLVEAVLMVTMYDTIRMAVERYQPDVIVSVFPYYQAPLAAYFALQRKRIPLMTVVTDLRTVQRVWFHQAADVTVVPTEIARKKALKDGLTEDQVHLIGIPVHPDISTPKDPIALRQKLGWATDKTTLLVVGSDRVNHIPEMLRALNHSGLDLQLVLVAGRSEKLLAYFNENEWHQTVQIYDFVDNMPELMHASDAIVCKAGGLIVTESLAAGLPILLIDAIEGQETGNVQHVVESGAGARINEPIDLLETVFHWAHDNLLAEKAKLARQAGRPEAAAEIAELTVNLIDSKREKTRSRFQLDTLSLSNFFERLGLRT
ncbi:MAG: hypothetical protein GYB68_01465 [Chloroflexi bacterium]|nr:hypothetical protein [Chloroflexota bacterium]